MKGKNIFATRWGIIGVGACIGILAPLLQKLGNPGNMGICVACFERDIAGAIGLHRAAVVQYIRPEIIGFVLGSLIAAYIFKEYRPRVGSAPIVRFVLGAFAMIGVPPTCGFFSKWYLILGGVEAGQWQFVVALVFSSLVNAVLFFRIIELAYFGSLADGEHHKHPESERHEAPWWIVSPLVVTTVFLIVVGLSTGPLVNNVIRLVIPAGF